MMKIFLLTVMKQNTKPRNVNIIKFHIRMSVGKNLFVLKHCTFFQIICHSVTKLLALNLFSFISLLILMNHECDEDAEIRLNYE